MAGTPVLNSNGRLLFRLRQDKVIIQPGFAAWYWGTYGGVTNLFQENKIYSITRKSELFTEVISFIFDGGEAIAEHRVWIPNNLLKVVYWMEKLS